MLAVADTVCEFSVYYQCREINGSNFLYIDLHMVTTSL